MSTQSHFSEHMLSNLLPVLNEIVSDVEEVDINTGVINIIDQLIMKYSHKDFIKQNFYILVKDLYYYMYNYEMMNANGSTPMLSEVNIPYVIYMIRLYVMTYLPYKRDLLESFLSATDYTQPSNCDNYSKINMSCQKNEFPNSVHSIKEEYEYYSEEDKDAIKFKIANKIVLLQAELNTLDTLEGYAEKAIVTLEKNLETH